jgi:hypothetical protein
MYTIELILLNFIITVFLITISFKLGRKYERTAWNRDYDIVRKTKNINVEGKVLKINGDK